MNAFTDPALFRFLLVVSVAIAFAVYTRFHLVGGGSVAGGYVAILSIAGQWQTLLGVALVTMLTLILLRGGILRVVALPRPAIFVLAVLTGSLITVALLALTPYIEAMSGFVGVSIAFGAFVIPGLISYDVSHQGLPRTMLALGAVAAGTVIICLPAFLHHCGHRDRWCAPLQLQPAQWGLHRRSLHHRVLHRDGVRDGDGRSLAHACHGPGL